MQPWIFLPILENLPPVLNANPFCSRWLRASGSTREERKVAGEEEEEEEEGDRGENRFERERKTKRKMAGRCLVLPLGNGTWWEVSGSQCLRASSMHLHKRVAGDRWVKSNEGWVAI